jgi:circadian clock protein KaiC
MSLALTTPSGIPGFDAISDGGLQRGRMTIVGGAPGAGKTVFALQHLMRGALEHREPGILFSFEERSANLELSAERFGWSEAFSGENPAVRIIDARPLLDAELAGEFDLAGLFARADLHLPPGSTGRLAFDGLDVVLDLLDEPAAQRRLLGQLYAWFDGRQQTCVVTARHTPDDVGFEPGNRGMLFDFLGDCVVRVDEQVEGMASLRSLRILKYRATPHIADPCPLIIGRDGMRVGSPNRVELEYPAWEERISTGIDHLDQMLIGGIHRGSSLLYTGAPGTSKTTCAGALVRAAAKRSERSLFISFDESPAQIERNLRSVGIDLRPAVDAGLLRIESFRSGALGTAQQLDLLQRSLDEHDPALVVLDPISALNRPSGLQRGAHAAHRAFDLIKGRGITLASTALVAHPEDESTSIEISTLADTWIHLDFRAHGGERNRGLTIVKSRGTGHSNQVRELELSSSGPRLLEVYTGGGHVLMGTARMEREQALVREAHREDRRREKQRMKDRAASAGLRAEIEVLQQRLNELESEGSMAEYEHAEEVEADSRVRKMIHGSRHGDPDPGDE